MTVSHMWLAIALWRLEALMRLGGVWRGLAFGAALGLMLIDRDHVAYLGAWFLVAYWLARFMPECRRQGMAVVRAQGPFVLGGLFALVLAAVPVVLLLQLAGESNRPTFGYVDASWQSLHPATLATFLMPEFFGSIHEPGQYWGPANDNWGGEFLRMHRGMLHLYAGALPIALILWHVATGRRFGAAWFFGAAAVASLIYASGRYTPVFELLYDHVPGVDLFRRPADALFLFGFVISLMTGALTHSALQPGGAVTASRLGLAALIAVVPLGLATNLSIGRGQVGDLLPSLAILLGLLFVIGGALTLASRRPRLTSAALATLVVVNAADLIHFSSGHNMNARPPDAYLPLETPGDDPLFVRLEALLAEPDPSGVPWRIETMGLGPTVQNIGQVTRYHNLLGYNPLRLAGFETGIGPRMQNNAGFNRRFGDRMTGYDSPMTNLLGVRYIVTGREIEELDPNVPPGRFNLIDQIERGQRTAYIYENPQALPRAVLAGEGRVRVTSYQTAQIEITVVAAAETRLILRDFHYPGWEAEVNGQPVEIERHDGLFRVVRVPAGDSVVRFAFRPLSRANLSAALGSLVER